MNHRTLRYLCREFTPHFADPLVTDLIMNRPHEIGVARAGEWHWHDSALSYDDCLALGILSAYVSGQDLSPSRPLVGTNLPDGQRIQVCRPNVTPDGTVSISIRNPTQTHKTTDDLAAAGMFDHADIVDDGKPLYAAVDTTDQRSIRARLEEAVPARKNILIGGDTGSGKTTLLNALSQRIPSYERAVTIEDRFEIKLALRNWVSLRYSKGDQGSAKVTPEELMEAALSMWPTRVLLGELRDRTTWTYLRDIVAGHRGGITTLHAGSAKGVFTSLRVMICQHEASRGLPDAEITAMLRDLVDIIVYCDWQKDRKPAYRIAQYYEKKEPRREATFTDRRPGTAAASDGADSAAADAAVFADAAD